MAATAMYTLALLAGGALAQQDTSLLIQTSAFADVAVDVEGSIDTMFEEGSFGLLPDEAPVWCKNESQLTWKQRKERMQQHTTLLWAKKVVEQMRQENETIPDWMDKIVSDDEKRGKMKWAVMESKRLKAEGQETPAWMNELVEEDQKWANRWAACKSAELKAQGEEVPSWMVENGRKGVMDAATEKAAEIQDEIDELDQAKEQETSLVAAQGDAELASQRMLARKREVVSTGLGQQFRVLEGALKILKGSETEAEKDNAPEAKHKVKLALRRAISAVEMLSKILERKSSMLLAKMTEK